MRGMTGVRILRYAAFTAAGAGGNPAGIVLDAQGLDDGVRLAVAAEVGYSETAFVDAPGPDGRHRVRYFSPQAEVDFCGHATVATAVAMAERGHTGTLEFDTRAGLIEVSVADGPDGPVATLTSVATRTRPATVDEVRETLAALGWSPDLLDPRYPAHVAYAGNEHLILAVRARATLAALDYDYPSLAAVMRRRVWTTVHLVWAESATVFHARDPFPPGGVVEDPATGAAAAAFGGYLRDLGLVPVPGQVTIHQGEDMGRPSRLVVEMVTGDRRVQVSGAAAPIGDDRDTL